MTVSETKKLTELSCYILTVYSNAVAIRFGFAHKNN